jgi:hypothetical protein
MIYMYMLIYMYMYSYILNGYSINIESSVNENV